MKPKNINPFFDFLKIIIGSLLFIAIVCGLAYWSRKNIDTDKKQLDEMRVYHSDKGLVEEYDGFLIIKIQ